MATTIKQDISLLNINLSNARSENESYKAYRERLTTNKQILKTYFQYGREGFRAMFPNGVADAMQEAQAQATAAQTTIEPQTIEQPTDSPVEYRLTSE
jgi:hypothetical protein|tara:strand:- start:25 stop:318 length:294 start_codon:yes stop_codon:yes gene_type:complete